MSKTFQRAADRHCRNCKKKTPPSALDPNRCLMCGNDYKSKTKKDGGK